MIVRKVQVSERELYRIGCLLPIIIGIIIGAVAWFKNSSIGHLYNARHADSDSESARYYIYYLADAPDGMYAPEAEDFVLKYYSGERPNAIISDYKYSSDTEIKDAVNKINNKLNAIHRR